MRRCVGMGGGALLGDFVGGGAGAASFAMRAAMAEALPDDLGVFAAAFSFLAASSLAFALAIISATPIFYARRRRSEVLGHQPFLWVLSGAASTELRRQDWAALGVAQKTRAARGCLQPLKKDSGLGWL